jgi:hypothetical protein
MAVLTYFLRIATNLIVPVCHHAARGAKLSTASVVAINSNLQGPL